MTKEEQKKYGLQAVHESLEDLNKLSVWMFAVLIIIALELLGIVALLGMLLRPLILP